MTAIERALTVRQPWAWAILRGFKAIELRTWRADYRGPLVIHASSSRVDCHADAAATIDGIDPDVARQSDVVCDWWDAQPRDTRPTIMPFGAFAGHVDLVDCVEAGDLPAALARHGLPDRQLYWQHDGLYHWILAHPVHYAEPIPAKGRLNLWRLTPAQQVDIAKARQVVIPQGLAGIRKHYQAASSPATRSPRGE